MLSAVEGLKLVTNWFDPYVVPIAVGIIVALFLFPATRHGHSVASWFGPITLVWFIVLALGGAMQVSAQSPGSRSGEPFHAVSFLLRHGEIGLFTLGAVFLAVTGAEALYADLGHFGRKPIGSPGCLSPCPRLR
ncbi:MAG: KUP/HAK/KT family potassium transporter [Methylocystis sp.]